MRKSSALLTAACFAAFAAPVSAASIDITGVIGSGVVKITFSGTAKANADGALPMVGDNAFASGIDLQFDSFLADTSIQNQLFAVTGNLSITQGTNVGSITQIFLDEDAITDAASNNPDDFGLRTASLFEYSVTGGDLIFAGMGTIPLDISAFKEVISEPNSPAINFLAATQADLTVTVTAVSAVPLPAGLPLLGGGLALAAYVSRRRT